MKKFLKVFGVLLLIFIALLAILPFVFQDQIEESLKKNINKNLNAKVEWQNLNLSLFTDFPNAEIGLENLFITNKEPFKGDTLFYSQNFRLHMGLFQLLSPEELVIDDVEIQNANLNIQINENGVANYDIAIKSPDSIKSDTNNSESNFKLQLKSYSIENTNLIYKDAGNIEFRLNELNHSGKGDFSKNTFTLETKTDSKISLVYDKTNYLNNNSIELDADIAIDLDKMRFTFEDNFGKINQLPLNFDGFLQVSKDFQEMDIKFSTPDSDFKNLLALIPQTYSGNLEDIDTKGEFNLEGRIFGKVDDSYIPKLNIELSSRNAEFQYANLPNKMENINLDVTILNSTGLVEDTAVDVNKLDFRIGKDQFSSAIHIKDLTENIKTDIVAKGVINLANLSKTYPIDSNLNLNGVLDMDLETHFDMNSLEQKQYENINSRGKLLLSDFKYDSNELANAFEIELADLTFNKASAKLNDFRMKTGQTDLKANGQLNNLIGYLFSNEDLSGNFQAMSNKFVVSDFMTSENDNSDPQKEIKSSAPIEEAIKIPSKLDLSLSFTANEVVYNNFNLKNIAGRLSVKDQSVNLSQIQANLFGGQVIVDGNVSTKEEKPNFGLKLKLNEIDIATSLEQIEMFQAFTPIFKSLVGVFTTEFDFSGNMTNSLSPILSSLDGNGLANIIQAKIEPSRVPLANSLNQQMGLIDFDDLKIKDIVTSFSFQNGNINVKPIQFEIEDIEVNLQGKHSLNNVMDYTADLKLPAKYLGNDIKSQIAKLSNTDIDSLVVYLPISIKGALKKPNISIDTKSAINELTNKIIQEQKDNLIDQAGDKLNDLLNGNKPTDSTKTQDDEVKETVKNVLGNLLKGKKKKDDGN